MSKATATRKYLKMVQLGVAGAIVGVAVANIIANLLGIDGPHQEVGAVAGGLLTATFVKLAHLV